MYDVSKYVKNIFYNLYMYNKKPDDHIETVKNLYNRPVLEGRQERKEGIK